MIREHKLRKSVVFSLDMAIFCKDFYLRTLGTVSVSLKDIDFSHCSPPIPASAGLQSG